MASSGAAGGADHAMSSAMAADDNKNRRSSKRVQNAANGKKQKGGRDTKKLKRPLCTVDFAKLEMSSLLKYKRHFKLPLRPAAPKIELIQHVRRHFVQHPRLRDVDVIASFLFANQSQKAANKQALVQAQNMEAEAKAATAAAAAEKAAGGAAAGAAGAAASAAR